MLYSQATTPQPHIYSTLTEPPGEHTEITEDYGAISNTATYATVGASDDGLYNHTHHGPTAPPTIGDINNGGYSVITKTKDTSNDGLVYSAVVRQDGIKTTVKTTAQIDEQQQQYTSNDGLVYSAVVVKDGIKTTVKTTAQIDEQQQQSVSDTSNEGLVYSAVVVKDGIKTTVKTTVFKD